MSKLGTHCQLRTWDRLHALNIELLDLSLVPGCILSINLALATNRARELSWARACVLMHDCSRLIERPVFGVGRSFLSHYSAGLSNVPHLTGFACIFLSNPHSCMLALK